MENTMNTLEQLRVDAMYGKKKHFNAADRINKYHDKTNYLSLFLNLFTFSALFFVMTDGATNWIKYVPLVFSLVATLLGFVQTVKNWPKTIESHRRIGNRYLGVMKECERLLGYWKDKTVTPQEFKESIEALYQKIEEINQTAESFPTSEADYELAKKGIENGQEFYTDTEKTNN